MRVFFLHGWKDGRKGKEWRTLVALRITKVGKNNRQYKNERKQAANKILRRSIDCNRKTNPFHVDPTSLPPPPPPPPFFPLLSYFLVSLHFFVLLVPFFVDEEFELYFRTDTATS